METSLKQRLLGAALLIALAVIFIPMLFDGDEREEPVTLDMDAPPEPEYSFEEPSKSAPKAQKPSEPPARKRVTPTEVAGLGRSRPTNDARSVSASGSARGAKPASTSDDPTEQPPPGRPLNDPQAAGPRQPSSPLPPPTAAASPNNPSSSQQQASPSAAPKGWAVQVGSFSEHENATSLRNELRGSGFTAFEERVVSDGEQVFRVKVGPAVNRTRAEALQAKLRNQEDLSGIVVSHRAPASR